MDEFSEAAAGRGDMLPAEMAHALLERYAESNRCLHGEWFADRPVLFPPDIASDSADPALDSAVLERFEGPFSAMFKG